MENRRNIVVILRNNLIKKGIYMVFFMTQISNTLYLNIIWHTSYQVSPQKNENIDIKLSAHDTFIE